MGGICLGTQSTDGWWKMPSEQLAGWLAGWMVISEQATF